MNEQANRFEQDTFESARPAREGSGASMVEYALLLASLCLVILVAFRGFSASTSTMFSGLSSDIQEAG